MVRLNGETSSLVAAISLISVCGSDVFNSNWSSSSTSFSALDIEELLPIVGWISKSSNTCLLRDTSSFSNMISWASLTSISKISEVNSKRVVTSSILFSSLVFKGRSNNKSAWISCGSSTTISSVCGVVLVMIKSSSEIASERTSS